MKTSICTLAALCALGCMPGTGWAAPVTAQFSGTISGNYNSNPQILNDFAVGTPVSFDITFDHTFALGGVPTSGDLGDVFGAVHVGADDFVVADGALAGYSHDFFSPEAYTVQLNGSGPDSPSGGHFFAVFIEFAADLQLLDGPIVGYGYPFPNGGTAFSYARLAGDFSIGPAASVPLPATLWLMLPGLAMLGWRRAVPSAGAARAAAPCLSS